MAIMSEAKSESTLRDYLALERTVMSNERTLLAYIRTGLALCVTGFTGGYLFTEIKTLAIFVSAVGILVVALGIIRFLHVKKRLLLRSDLSS